MAIYKAKVTTSYAIIPNGTAQDKRLSFEARGMLVLLLSMPDDWAINKEWLIKQSGAGRDKVNRILAELELVGYLTKYQSRECGKFSATDYFIYPTSGNNKSDNDEPVDGKPVDDKTPTTKETVIQSKQIQNKHLKPMSSSDDLDVHLIFDHWVSVMQKDPSKTKLTPKRKKSIQGRLKDGYTALDIKQAINNCSTDPFSMGMNDRKKQFNDIELICRSGEKLESFIDGRVELNETDNRTGKQELIEATTGASRNDW